MMHKYFVEFLGTLFLMFIILATGNWMAIGAALSISVMLGGAISQGCFNPSVTLALMYAGRLGQSDVVPYIVAQTAGALLAVELVKRMK
jgi:aquaporin Z